MTFVEAVPPLQTATAPRAGPSSVPSFLDRRQTSALAGLAAAAGLVVALSGLTPTGTAIWDGVLAAAMAAIFVLASARTHPRLLSGAALIALVFVGLTAWILVAAVAVALSVVALRVEHAVARAASGAVTIVALTHLSTFGVFGLSAFVAGLAVVVVLASGYRALAVESRVRIRQVIVWASVVIGGLLVVAAYQAVSIRATAESGVEAARQGLDAARAGDTPELTRQLDRAQLQLAQAEASGNSVWLEPLKLVPIAAQHVRSLNVATAQGLIVANEASAVLRDVDLDLLQLRQGQFDLDLLASMAPQLVSASTGLEEAVRLIERERSPWLVPPVANQLAVLLDEANQVLPETQLAADAARVMPGLLGANEERRYMMLFGAPGETREFGGFVGGYALLSVIDGGLDLVQAGSINDFLLIERADSFNDPESYPGIYVQADPMQFPQNLTSSPNLSLIARAAREVFPEVAGAPLDGLIYVDPFALAAMTDFTGPLTVSGLDEPLDRDGLVEFMFDTQYRIFDSRNARFGAMGALAQATAQGFENADLPGPERLGQVLGPMARAGRLQVVTYDDAENAFLASVLLQRDFSPRPDRDVMAVVQGNATASKLDLYLRRQMTYDVTVREDGTLSATVDVVLTSDIPPDAPELAFGETDGTNEVLLSLYTEHELVTVTVDGQPHEVATDFEFGFQRHALFTIRLRPNTSATAQFVLRGEAPAHPYELEIWSQPIVNTDTATAIYRTSGQEAVVANRQLFENWLFTPQVLPS